MEKRVKQYFVLPSIGNAVIRLTYGLEVEQLRLDAAAVVGDRLPWVLLKTPCSVGAVGQPCRHCDHGQGYRASQFRQSELQPIRGAHVIEYHVVQRIL